eukprot:9476275-Pyramimonas_sp.AAC.1
MSADRAILKALMEQRTALEAEMNEIIARRYADTSVLSPSSARNPQICIFHHFCLPLVWCRIPKVLRQGLIPLAKRGGYFPALFSLNHAKRLPCRSFRLACVPPTSMFCGEVTRSPLACLQGFPRADVDVHQARIGRNRLA